MVLGFCGSMATAEVDRESCVSVSAVQVAPPSVDRQVPPVAAAMKMREALVGSMAMSRTRPLIAPQAGATFEVKPAGPTLENGDASVTLW